MEILDRAPTWNRPKTTRRYVHPPMAERLVTLWAEGKIMMGEIRKSDGEAGYHKFNADGMWLVHGDADEQFDYTKVENVMDKEGIPVHGMKHFAGKLQVELETFCNIDRKPTCFVKLTLTNTGKEKTTEKMAFILRYGSEKVLMFGSPDGYAHYDPDVNVWKNFPSTFQKTVNRYAPVFTVCDDEDFVTACGELPLDFDDKLGAIRWTAELDGGETKTLYFALSRENALPFDYEQEKCEAYKFWKRELSRITKLPEKLKNDPEKLKIVKNLTVQMLQCFCYPIGKNYPFARQGGLLRLIWPWEAMPMLSALGDIGDFADYIEPVIGAYFDELQRPNGEIVTFGFGWASVTAAAVYSFAYYSKNRSRRFWYRYRNNAMAAFDWIKRMRASTVEDLEKGIYAGLFPPMRGCDWGEVFQVWGTTDLTNIDTLKMLAEAAEYFGDERAPEIRKEYEDYFAAVKNRFAQFVDECKGSPMLRVPICPSGDDDELVKHCYPRQSAGRFLYTGIIGPEDIDRVERWEISIGKCHEGLHGQMPYENGNMHIWYLSIPDYDWFMAKFNQGRIDEAEQIYQSQLKWGMTDEYYMNERYADNDEYYVPWSPNASASGRTVLMMLELAK